MATHIVSNQPPPLTGTNLLTIDHPLAHFLNRKGIHPIEADVKEYGRLMGTAKWIERGFLANENGPIFNSHDRFGNRIDSIEYHPAYHELMTLAMEHGLHCAPWKKSGKHGHLLRLAKYYLHAQNEAGTGCPITMTFSSYPAIANHFDQKEDWMHRIIDNSYDPENKPWFDKKGVTIGMAMTEKQGGTDVRANTTTAIPTMSTNQEGFFSLTGHKWFCSAPMCDAFLTLAQTQKGLTCFLFPRWRADGTKNSFAIQRLKDKLGNRSNASSEIEFLQAEAYLIGQEGRGIPTILEMVAMTRYDCMIGSSALMRRGITEVLHHIQHRKVHGRHLIEFPLMRNVAADLCLESEAALAMTVRAAECLDQPGNKKEQDLLRLLLPVGKYWITKRAEYCLTEAMECLGGNGYVEESIMPRLFREAPVNAIWEGSGNVQCLDVYRAIGKNPEVLDIYVEELEAQSGQNLHYDQFISKIRNYISQNLNNQHAARSLTGYLALAMQAAQLLRSGRGEIAKVFCKERLNGQGYLFGNLSHSKDIDSVINLNIF